MVVGGSLGQFVPDQGGAWRIGQGGRGERGSPLVREFPAISLLNSMYKLYATILWQRWMERNSSYSRPSQASDRPGVHRNRCIV